jgi:cation transport regulator ChaB
VMLLSPTTCFVGITTPLAATCPSSSCIRSFLFRPRWWFMISKCLVRHTSHDMLTNALSDLTDFVIFFSPFDWWCLTNPRQESEDLPRTANSVAWSAVRHCCFANSSSWVGDLGSKARGGDWHRPGLYYMHMADRPSLVPQLCTWHANAGSWHSCCSGVYLKCTCSQHLKFKVLGFPIGRGYLDTSESAYFSTPAGYLVWRITV